jgi:Transglutaminase-like superfamily
MSVRNGLLNVTLRSWPTLVHLGIAMVVIEGGLRLVRLPHLARGVGVPLSLTGRGGDAEGQLRLSRPEIDRLDLARRLIRRWPTEATCLRRSLLAGHVLRRRHPILRIGVAKVNGRVAAHAWLEIEGVCLDPSGAAQFEPLTVIDPSAGSQHV